jgi:hypothetical protein
LHLSGIDNGNIDGAGNYNTLDILPANPDPFDVGGTLHYGVNDHTLEYAHARLGPANIQIHAEAHPGHFIPSPFDYVASPGIPANHKDQSNAGLPQFFCNDTGANYHYFGSVSNPLHPCQSWPLLY